MFSHPDAVKSLIFTYKACSLDLIFSEVTKRRKMPWSANWRWRFLFLKTLYLFSSNVQQGVDFGCLARNAAAAECRFPAVARSKYKRKEKVRRIGCYLDLVGKLQMPYGWYCIPSQSEICVIVNKYSIIKRIKEDLYGALSRQKINPWLEYIFLQRVNGLCMDFLII